MLLKYQYDLRLFVGFFFVNGALLRITFFFVDFLHFLTPFSQAIDSLRYCLESFANLMVLVRTRCEAVLFPFSHALSRSLDICSSRARIFLTISFSVINLHPSEKFIFYFFIEKREDIVQCFF